jgi:hypothetical protein
LGDFICAFSFQHKHYLVEPVKLLCGHAPCSVCVENLKKNTGLKEVKRLKCNRVANLENEYFVSDLIKNYINDNSSNIFKSLKQQLEEILIQDRSKIKIIEK